MQVSYFGTSTTPYILHYHYIQEFCIEPRKYYFTLEKKNIFNLPLP